MTEEDVIGYIEKMPVLDLSKFIKKLEDRLGVTAAMPMMAAGLGAAAGPAAAPKAEEKTEFKVVLTAVGAQKLQVIKVVREITGLGLKEAKEFVESAPKPIKEAAQKAEAEDIKKKLTEVGATVELQ
ncbi:MAG: 50S ribosomal protein L7/L12 [Nitrospirae bacterium]|nr:50S ribosomal protein L7/L12 [Nitrospirota bacterium]